MDSKFYIFLGGLLGSIFGLAGALEAIMRISESSFRKLKKLGSKIGMVDYLVDTSDKFKTLLKNKGYSKDFTEKDYLKRLQNLR